MRGENSYHIYAGITILFWSMAYVFTRLSLQHFSPFSLGFVRYVVATATLIIIGAAARLKPPKRSDLKWFAAAGFFGFFLYMIAFNQGCQTVASSTSSVIIATVPVFTALLARFVYHETLRPVQWVAIAVEFFGVAVLLLLNRGFSFNWGVIWLLAAAMSLSIYNLLQRKLTRSYSALSASAFSIFAGTAMLAVFLPGSASQVRTAPPEQLLYVAILGVFPSAIAFIFWAKAFSKARRASSVSNYMFITPLLATLLGFLLAHEKPDMPTIVGGAVILLGLLIFNLGGVLIDRLFPKADRQDVLHSETGG